MHEATARINLKWLLSAFLIAISLPSHARAAKPSQRMSAADRCHASYLNFYHADDLDFRIVFGYKDARPARLVTDRYERNWLVAEIEKLGFTRDSDDEELFRFEMRGPDAKSKRIHLRVVESSVGADDEVNRKDPFQKWQSAHAREIFLAGVKTASLVLYVGHSRKGGGPDFDPPRLAASNHVDYAWYESNKIGLRDLKVAMRGMEEQSRLIGLFSCDSSRHFSIQTHKLNSKVGFIGNSSNLYYSDSIADTVELLESLIQQKCVPEFSPAGTHLQGFIN